MNLNTLVIVADAARARLLRVVETEEPRARFALREEGSLVHPVARIKESERYSDSFPGGARASRNGSAHTFDDHRLAHDAEERRRFARSIAEVAAHLVNEQALNPVIVTATHAMHSVLMGELSQVLPKHVYVRSELGELSEHSPAQLLHDLTERGLFRP
jgi:protein required for attachment to host cells